jgi:hypothetical protein
MAAKMLLDLNAEGVGKFQPRAAPWEITHKGSETLKEFANRIRTTEQILD